jgi:coproporphyrinogen III oxidase
VGGIFYDYLNSGNFEADFNFTKKVGLAFLDIFPKIIRRNMYNRWSEEQREYQLKKRGFYTEFNLVYDRGTRFGLMTEGNTEAILMSLPPIAKWD